MKEVNSYCNDKPREVTDLGLRTFRLWFTIFFEMMTNQTDTLVAGNDWYEFNSTFVVFNIGIGDAATQFSNEGWSSVFIGEVSGLVHFIVQ